MTAKHINHGAIQKVYHLYNGIFHSINRVTLSQFYSITSLILFMEWNGMRENKIFLYIWLLQRITLYQSR